MLIGIIHEIDEGDSWILPVINRKERVEAPRDQQIIYGVRNQHCDSET